MDLAHLYVDIEARDAKFNSQLNDVKNRIGGFGSALSVAFGNLASGAIASAVGTLGDFFSGAIKGGVDLQETTSKVQAIFGQASGVIQAEAEKMASSFGVAKVEFLDAAASFGAAFKGAGATVSEAAKIGNQLAKLGMDMASFGNASNQEVFTALQAAIRGEFDPLERFTVFLNANKVALEAVNLGLAKNKNEVSDLAKQQATLSLIMKGTADQQGDLARTADGTANSWRKLTGDVQNIAVGLATKLTPALNSVIGLGGDLVSSLGSGLEAAGPTIDSYIAVVVKGFEGVRYAFANVGTAVDAASGGIRSAWNATVETITGGVLLAAGPDGLEMMNDAIRAAGEWVAYFRDLATAAVDKVVFVWNNLGAVTQGVLAIAGAYWENFASIVQTAAKNMVTIAGWVGENWYALIVDSVKATGAALQNFATNIGNLFTAVLGAFSDPAGGFNFEWTPLLDGFEATVSKFPELAKAPMKDVAQVAADAWTEVMKKDEERLKDIRAATIGPPKDLMSDEAKKAADAAGSAAAAQKAKGDRFRSELVDVGEFTNRLRASIFGGRDDTQKQQLDVAKESLKVNKDILVESKKFKPARIG